MERNTPAFQRDVNGDDECRLFVPLLLLPVSRWVGLLSTLLRSEVRSQLFIIACDEGNDDKNKIGMRRSEARGAGTGCAHYIYSKCSLLGGTTAGRTHAC